MQVGEEIQVTRLGVTVGRPYRVPNLLGDAGRLPQCIGDRREAVGRVLHRVAEVQHRRAEFLERRLMSVPASRVDLAEPACSSVFFTECPAELPRQGKDVARSSRPASGEVSAIGSPFNSGPDGAGRVKGD
jgi:hypothetical protein